MVGAVLGGFLLLNIVMNKKFFEVKDMCELLGMSFNKTIQPIISFKGFWPRGNVHPDGWGLAYYPDESVQIVKEPIRTGRSELAGHLRHYKTLKSKIFIAHVRQTSVGSKSYKNTHPFYRELNGREYVFAHNGTIYYHSDLDIGRFIPVGETDSEYVFCNILEGVAERNLTYWSVDDYRWLFEKMQEINSLGRFNCIFSDGNNLFCYHDQEDYNGLFFVKRRLPYRSSFMEDQDFVINFASAIEQDPGHEGYVIATQPLSNEQWDLFHPGELLVFNNGHLIYSSAGRPVDADDYAFDKTKIRLLVNKKHLASG
jgi:predicted glutamine amidotransferase